MQRKYLLCFLLVATTVAIGVFTWKTAYQSALQELQTDTNRKLAQATDQFRGQLSSARILPTLLARNNEIVSSLENESINDIVVEYLVRARDLSSANEIRLINSKGEQLYSTSQNTKNSTSQDNKNQNELGTAYFSKAMQGALGVAIRYSKDNNIRTITFARSVLSPDFKQLGAVVLEMDVEILESEFRARPEVLMFLDSAGVVVFSNRTGLVFSKLQPYQPILKTQQPAFVSVDSNITELQVDEAHYGSIAIWKNFSAAPFISAKLVARQTLLTTGLEAVLLVDTKTALLQARKITSLSIALLILAIVSGIAVFQRRRRFIERIEAEQALIRELDKRVERRSKELERAQNELVQSAKLSALGTMSAGISHELSQPIASIQNFAVNAKRFLVDGRVEESMLNLTDIEMQTERMSRIIRHLRDFARKDALPRDRVDMCEVVSAVSKMVEPRLKEEGVTITILTDEQSIMVMGGEIRLQQVLINLISNAIEALKNQSDKHIHINTVQVGQLVEVSIRDNGPGLPEPTRIFEPFYTTKSGSHDNGLGLGLSIAYGFVESFGGTLRATNCDDGGALFTLNLPAVRQSE